MHRLVSFVFAAGIVLVAGCKPNLTPISQLLNDPGQYDHKIVRVAGKVTHSIGLLGYGGYQIDDGSGQITVVTKSGGAPREGAEVGVEGEFRSGFTLGTESIAAVIEKRRFTP